MLKLCTFGGLTLSKGDALVTGAAAQRRRLALLAVLATSGGRGVSRDRLLVLFWPETDEERGRHALGQAVYATKRDLGDDRLIQGTTELRLDSDAIRSDVGDFAETLARGDFRSAVDHYAGPFLDGFHMKGAPEFERWVDDERGRLRREYIAALERLAAEADAGRDRVDAVAWWNRLAIADPLSARIACGLVNAYAAAGDRSAALQHARVHEAYVRAELGVDPDPTVAALADRLTTLTSDAASLKQPIPHSLPAAKPASFESGPREVISTDRRNAAAARMFRQRIIGTSLLGVAALVGAAALADRGSRDQSNRSEHPRVVVARFDNVTGDTALAPLGQLTADWITDELARTGIVDVVDAQSVCVSTRAADSSTVSGTAWLRAVAENAGAEVVVSGRVYRDRDALVIRAHITDARNGAVLRPIEAVRGDPANPMRAADAVRARVMGALATIVDPKLASLTTVASRPPTYEAYRTYVAGLDSFARGRYVPSRALFLKAARLDSGFSLALFWASHAAANAGDLATMDSLTDVLRTRRQEFPPAEQHAVDAIWEAKQGNRERELDAYRRAAELAPASQWMFMRGRRAAALGLYDEALASLLAIDPYRGWTRGWPPYWVQLLDVYHNLGRYDDEIAVSRRAQRAFPSMMHLKAREMMALAALGRADQVLYILDSLASSPRDGLAPSPGAAYDVALGELVAHGYPSGARRVAEACVAWHRRTGSAALAGSLGQLNERARCLTRAGLLEEARADYEQAIRRGPSAKSVWDRVQGVRGYVGLGLIAAERGDTAEAYRMAGLLTAAYPAVDPYDGVAAAHRTSALIAAILGDRDRAVGHLREAARIQGPIDDSHQPALMKLRGYPPYDAVVRRYAVSKQQTWAQRVRAVFVATSITPR